MFKKADLWILAAVALLLAAALVLTPALRTTGGDTVQVRKNGVLIGSYALSEDREIVVDAHNTLRIEGGRLYMESADCPDRCCVEQGGIAAGAIVCLPNRLSAEIVSSDPDAAYDGVTGTAR